MDDAKQRYEGYLAEARRQAEAAVSASERSSWQTIAASWARLLSLAELEPQPQPQQQPQQKLQDGE
jgi:hypothetical protein